MLNLGRALIVPEGGSMIPFTFRQIEVFLAVCSAIWGDPAGPEAAVRAFQSLLAK